ncbi:MAG: hypothetical protein M1830_006909 [Pleopsidium flavum]|nr:MAG: hypothetical protein M1830_006909 [Pleopsidium flavum]
MPDRPLTIATYAAGASLAAATLIYVFGPTFFLDGDSSNTSSSTRRKGIVGLSNPANDCFINSVLQALAGLGDLRTYLIKELHRRNLDGPDIYLPESEKDEHGRSIDQRKLEGLQNGQVTQALKQILDSLNERPIYKKTISAGAFVVVLEDAFRTRISRQQQDAQEFLQVVAERLSDEYHAGRKARLKSKQSLAIDGSIVIVPPPDSDVVDENGARLRDVSEDSIMSPGVLDATEEDAELDRSDDLEVGFPFEGKLVSQIECQLCHFKTKPNSTTFVTLTLHVPQKNSTTLSSCFDSLLKTEYIDDFKCDRCRLEHALTTRSNDLAKAPIGSYRVGIESDIEKIQTSIREDPEKPPEGVILPDIKLAPKRRIAKHMQITSFPKIMAIHLSRSIFDPRSLSTKNAAKVSFPEKLPLGGILDRRQYKLLGVVTHRGSHNSGHYETFRRQNLYPPYSTPNLFSPNGAYSTPAASSTASSPHIPVSSSKVSSSLSSPEPSELVSSSTISSSPSLSSLSLPSTRPSTGSNGPTSQPSLTSTPRENTQAASKPPNLKPETGVGSSLRLTRRKSADDRWWRISDEKIKECRTSDVLGMQKEVYMLFYEQDKEKDSE